MPPEQFAPLHSRSVHTAIASPPALAAMCGSSARFLVSTSVAVPQTPPALRLTQILPQPPANTASFHATKPTPWLVSATAGVNISIEFVLRKLLIRSELLQTDGGGDGPGPGPRPGPGAGGFDEPPPPPPPPPQPGRLRAITGTPQKHAFLVIVFLRDPDRSFLPSGRCYAIRLASANQKSHSGRPDRIDLVGVISHARPSIKQGRSTMTTRREFIFAAAAVAAMLTRISSALAATYDLVIKGGRVIDPAARINAMRDVAIVGGRIAAIESNIAADGAQTLDARGKLVVPGLIDVDTHAAPDREMPAIWP